MLKAVRKILRRIPPETVLPVLTGPLRGTRWIVGASRNAYWLGTYERSKCKVFAAAIAEGDVVYDVGAHVGYYTLLASKLVGARGHVYAFEPLPANLEFLERHLKLNQITNVTVVPAAVSDATGLVQQHDETARYGCESAPNYTGKKKGATPQFHFVALLVLCHTDIVG